MSYLTPTEFVELYQQDEVVQLSNLDDPLGTGTDIVLIQQALNDASEWANGYLAGRYALPLSVVPMLLKRLVGDIARYYLHRYDPPEDVRKRYEDAFKMLEKIRKGEIDLGLSQAGEEIAPSLGVQFSPGKSAFDMEGF